MSPWIKDTLFVWFTGIHWQALDSFPDWLDPEFVIRKIEYIHFKRRGHSYMENKRTQHQARTLFVIKSSATLSLGVMEHSNFTGWLEIASLCIAGLTGVS